jgi:hypothetical protein
VSPDDLTTPAERAGFCSTMRQAKTPAERQAAAQAWHELLASRAKERGVDLPNGMGSHHPMMGHDDAMPMDMGMGMTCSRFGADTPPSSDASGPPVARSQGIAYVTGGVGADEAAAMRSIASRYSMRVRFTASGGEFVSGVALRVMSADGRVIFAAISDGPYLFAQIPPGRYRLLANLDGLERSRGVDIPRRGGVTVSLTWPATRTAKGG